MEYLQIGKVSNVHGIKGEIKVIPLTDDLNRFSELKSVYIGIDKECYEIEKASYHKNQAILKLKGISELEKAENLINSFLWVKIEDAKRPKGAYFLFELIGLEVFNVEGEYIGKLKDVLQPGANDVYIVKNEDREYLIPAVKEIVKSIDIEHNKMTIQPIEGMIE